jgi:hypothetical protein
MSIHAVIQKLEANTQVTPFSRYTNVDSYNHPKKLEVKTQVAPFTRLKCWMLCDTGSTNCSCPPAVLASTVSKIV